MSPDTFVRLYEGTYNPANGHFACTPCYFAMGTPMEEWRTNAAIAQSLGEPSETGIARGHVKVPTCGQEKSPPLPS